MKKQETLDKVLKFIENMPPLNQTTEKIIEISNRNNVTAPELNKVISLDPVLTAKVLKLINSAYYGLNNKINSLIRAIIMLGTNTVKNLAISTTVLSNIEKNNLLSTKNKNFWEYSISVGIISKLIAKKRGIDPLLLENYFVCGLLHGLGKIPLCNIFEEEYIATLKYIDDNKVPLFIAEKETLGITHNEVGDLIAKTWNLNKQIRDSIAFYEEPGDYDKENIEYVYTVSLANYYSNILDIGYSGDKYPKKPEDKINSFLNINDSILDEIESVVEEEIKKAKVFLTVAK